MNDNASLAHHGVLGMKWGIRRYQNEDGSWTKAGLRKAKRMRRWAKSIPGRIAIKYGAKMGMTPASVYVARQQSMSAVKGFFLGGPAGASLASFVTSKRLKAGADFIREALGE